MVNVVGEFEILEGKVVHGDGNYLGGEDGFWTRVGLEDDVFFRSEGVVGPSNAAESGVDTRQVGGCVG